MKIQSILMKKHVLLIILGGILLISGLVLSLNKKKTVIYYTEEVLSKEQASNLVIEKTKSIIDIYENQEDTFKVVKKIKTPEIPKEDVPEGEEIEIPTEQVNDLYIEVKNYDEIIDEIYSKAGKEELEKIAFSNNLFVKKDNDTIYVLKEIPSNNKYSTSSITVSDVAVTLDTVKAKVSFTRDEVDSADTLTYYVYEKDIVLVKDNNKWLVESFNYLNV